LQDRTKKIDALGKQLHALQEKLAHEQQEKQKLGDSIQRLGAALDSVKSFL
jgi:septal ring factor EnvC (AmiA/AmiB activator)